MEDQEKILSALCDPRLDEAGQIERMIPHGARMILSEDNRTQCKERRGTMMMRLMISMVTVSTVISPTAPFEIPMMPAKAGFESMVSATAERTHNRKTA